MCMEHITGLDKISYISFGSRGPVPNVPFAMYIDISALALPTCFNLFLCCSYIEANEAPASVKFL